MKMNKKGFTLIELLAVIVILAIIALIATPIILGIINDARNNSKKRSAEMVSTGVEYAYTTSLYNDTNGTVVTVPTLKDIKNNLNIKNMKSAELDSDATPTKLTIKTDDAVTCDVTIETKQVKTDCGDYGSFAFSASE